MDNKNITVVINTFNSEEQIFNCIDSIGSNFKIVVIENSNKTKFKDMLEKKYENVECFLTGENLGYAKGNNYGLSKVKSQFALILNPDTFLKEDAIENFFNFLRTKSI